MKMGKRVASAGAAVVVLLVSLVVAACGGGGGSSSSSGESKESGGSASAPATSNLVATSWGGTFQEDVSKFYFQPFAKQEGIDVQEAEVASAAKIKAMVLSDNVEWDVPTVTAADYAVLKKGGLLEKLDYSGISSAEKGQLVAGALMPYGMVMDYYSCGITYRTDLEVKGHPENWEEFWDTKRFPGPRALPKASYAIPPWEAALMASGVSPEDLYPLDYDRAIDSLDKIKGEVTLWYEDTAQAVQALVDGEVDYAMLCNNRVGVAAQEGEPVGVEWNQSLINTDVWVVPKGAPNVANAMKFLAFTADPSAEAKLIEAQPVGLPNKEALQIVGPKVAELLPTSEENLPKQVAIDAEFYASKAPNGKTQAEYALERWNEWFGGA